MWFSPTGRCPLEGDRGRRGTRNRGGGFSYSMTTKKEGAGLLRSQAAHHTT
jgi:hypothetical protein